MNKNLLVKSEIRNNQKIEVYYDNCAESPCTSWDMGCCYLFEYSRGNSLHDDCNWRELFGKYGDNRHSLEDCAKRLVSNYVNQDDIRTHLKNGSNLRMRYDRSDREWKLEYYYDYSWLNGWYEKLSISPADWKKYDWVDDIVEYLDYDTCLELLEAYGKDIVVKETSSTGYCQGDYCKILCYCTKERFDKYIGSNGTPWKEHALSLMDSETEAIGRWMWGDVYGYVLYDKVEQHISYPNNPDRDDEDDEIWEESDSCWGFFCDPDEVIDEILGEEVKTA